MPVVWQLYVRRYLELSIRADYNISQCGYVNSHLCVHACETHMSEVQHADTRQRVCEPLVQPPLHDLLLSSESSTYAICIWDSDIRILVDGRPVVAYQHRLTGQRGGRVARWFVVLPQGTSFTICIKNVSDVGQCVRGTATSPVSVTVIDETINPNQSLVLKGPYEARSGRGLGPGWHFALQWNARSAVQEPYNK
jgi:hypothetical protein